MPQVIKAEYWTEVYNAVGDRWPNFDIKDELACRCCGGLTADIDFLDRIQAARTAWCFPFNVRSYYRCEKHNRAEGGAPNSYHRDGRAIDISLDGYDRYMLENCLREVGEVGCVAHYSDFLHSDDGPQREWDTGWTPDLLDDEQAKGEEMKSGQRIDSVYKLCKDVRNLIKEYRKAHAASATVVRTATGQFTQHGLCPKQRGALKARSMELTRALAEMRKTGGLNL